MMISQRRAYLLLLLEGFASTSVQMLSIRQSMPYAGSSVAHTSVIIAVFLAALAMGYVQGGRVKQEDFVCTLTRNLLIATAIFVVGFNHAFLTIFFAVTQPVGHPLIQLGLYAIVILAPLVYLLAQTVPLLIHALETNSKTKASGDAYGLSTVGNVLGVLVTSLVIMFYLGIGYAVTINAFILLLCSVICNVKLLNHKLLLASVIGLGLFNVGGLLANNEASDIDNQYSMLKVEGFSDGETQGRVLVNNNSLASFIDSRNNGWPYIQVFKNELKYHFERQDYNNYDLLVLGAGGFTLTANQNVPPFNHIGLTTTYVDIDPDLPKLSQTKFLNEPINGQFVRSDARLFALSALNKNKLYDAVVIDLYSNHSTIPEHVSTIQFHQLVNRVLNENGIVLINVIGSPKLDNDYSRAMDATVRTAYQYCRMQAIQDEALANLIYACTKKAKKPIHIFSDNDTRASILAAGY